MTGLAVVLYACALVWMSTLLQGAPPGENAPGDLVVLFVGVTLAVSLLYIGSCIATHRAPPSLAYILVVGAVARMFLVFGSPGPILEGDHERMRFDARLVNRGIHPYAYRPSDLADDSPRDRLLGNDERARMAEVRARMTSSEGGPRPESVQRPDLRPIQSPAPPWVIESSRKTPVDTRFSCCAPMPSRVS